MIKRFIKQRETFIFLILLALSFAFLLLYRKGVKLWEISPGKSLIRFLSIVCLILLTFLIFSRIIRLFVRLHHGPKGETKMLVGFWRAMTGLAIILAFVESMGKITIFGAIAAGFVGMLLGWSLQAPVSGIAAWVLITLKRPFRIGDRIQFSSLGLVGDVTDIGLMYTVLNQVGGAVGSEEAIGRPILIPNAMLFSQVVINYTTQQEEPYFLDEVIVRITFDSDWELAEKILLNSAKEVTADVIKKTGKEPYIRSDIYDYGVYLRLRYITKATERPRIAHEINKRILKQFQENRKVDFAIPYIYSYREGEKGKKVDEKEK